MTNVLEQITRMVSGHKAAQYEYPGGQGKAPLGYMKGMALTYARVLFKLQAKDPGAVFMAQPATHDSEHDALAYYRGLFDKAGLKVDAGGVTTLRCLWNLLTGLAMPESSGEWYCGRDRSASNTSADTAEAGLFQTSWNAQHNSKEPASNLLLSLYTRYIKVPADRGWLDVFQEGCHAPTAANLQNFGSGVGAKFQEMAKHLPSFAAEFAGITLRSLRSHYGTINRYEAKLNPFLDAMLREVEEIVATDPAAFAMALADIPATAPPTVPVTPLPPLPPRPAPKPIPIPPVRKPPVTTTPVPTPAATPSPILALIESLLPEPYKSLSASLPIILALAQEDVQIFQQVEAAPDLPGKIMVLSNHFASVATKLQEIAGSVSGVIPALASTGGTTTTAPFSLPGLSIINQVETDLHNLLASIGQMKQTVAQ